MFCKQCRYPLAQLNGSVCPECGGTFDPKNPRTYMQHPSRRLGWRGRLFLLLAIYLGGYFTARGFALMVHTTDGLTIDGSVRSYVVAGHHPGETVFSSIRNAVAKPVSIVFMPLRHLEAALWNACSNPQHAAL